MRERTMAPKPNQVAIPFDSLPDQRQFDLHLLRLLDKPGIRIPAIAAQLATYIRTNGTPAWLFPHLWAQKAQVITQYNVERALDLVVNDLRYPPRHARLSQVFISVPLIPQPHHLRPEI